MFNDTIRPRRLRTSAGLRKLVRETRISPESLIWPIFVAEGENIYEEIPSLPGQYHYSPDELGRMVERAHEHGVSRVILFGLPKDKDEIGSGAWAEDGIVQQGIRKIKELDPEMYVVTDVCMCEYTSHGHCGILCGDYVDNDQTIARLAQIAVSHAKAGADMVAPSDMMDGRVAAIREALDRGGLCQRADHVVRGQVRLLLSMARSAMRRAPRRRSATAAPIRWTGTTAARPCANARSTCRRARTS